MPNPTTIQLTSPVCYAGGVSGASRVIGYESSRNRVMRFQFTTGSEGATGISITAQAGTIVVGGGLAFSNVPFYITTDQNSHANANVSDGYAVTGYISGSSNNAYTGSANIILKADTTYYIWFFPNVKKYGYSMWNDNASARTSCTISGTSKFALTINAGTGSTISVNRMSSQVGMPTGIVSDNDVLYYGDSLKITFAADTNYALNQHTVNGATFTSGNTHTVAGNVSVASTATVLASSVGATNADIGSISTVVVTKYSQSYYHSLQYSFNGLTGYINANGSTSSSEVKISQTTVAFSVPTSFYAKIPSSKTDTCTITCRTYSSQSSTTVLGTPTTTTFVVTANSAINSPTVTGTVIDINSDTAVLTGDSSVLIRYKSTAECTISATAKNSATITAKTINGGAVSNDKRTFVGVTDTAFTFYAVDSRGYSGTDTVTPVIISYVNLTCNPLISRPSPTSSEIVMTVSGDMYRGSFGAYSNTLTMRYRYRESSGTYGAWSAVSSGLIYGTSNYRSDGTISLGNSFDYQKGYEFQIQVIDGANGVSLSTVTKTVSIQRGLPVFDWGEDDFNFNVIVNASKGVSMPRVVASTEAGARTAIESIASNAANFSRTFFSIESSDMLGGTTFFCTLDKYSDNYYIINGSSYADTGRSFKMIKLEGILSDVMWVNPPLTSGREYLTTELYNGSPVYVQRFWISSLPNNTTGFNNLLAGVKQVVGADFSFSYNSIYYAGFPTNVTKAWAQVGPAGTLQAYFTTNANLSGWNSSPIIKYLKQ